MPDSIKQFLATLAERTVSEGIEWSLTPIGRIQWRDGLNRRLCPLAFWTEDPDRYEFTAKRLGMRTADVAAVMNAADNFPATGYPGLRAALLKATGLA